MQAIPHQLSQVLIRNCGILSTQTPTYTRPEKRCASRLSSRGPRPRAQSIIGPPMTYATSCVLCAYHMPDLGETGESP